MITASDPWRAAEPTASKRNGHSGGDSAPFRFAGALSCRSALCNS